MSNGMRFTIFGGTGDLTFRKLLPALYNMKVSGRLTEEDRIIIIGRRDYTDEEYCALAQEWVQKFARLPFSREEFSEFAGLIRYFRMDFSDKEAYADLNDFYAQKKARSHIFYFAVAPRFFPVIVDGLKSVDGARDGKVILEKPFGENLRTAKELNKTMEDFFGPESIYRIDHYLGKEMVRNIQTIRFANPIFRDVWDAEHIESVQISALEDVGVETRGGYYDMTGALKDMVQNHLFQILSIVAMEQPERLFGTEMHEEQLKVLRALRSPDRESVGDYLLLGQYEGYREEPKIYPQSNTETFAALRVYVDNDRWRNMPFYIRTGKKTGRREMEVAVVFKRESPDAEPNVLIIRIQPTEGVYLQFNIKKPGDTEEIISTKMDFCQSCNDIFRINTPEAYERLLVACAGGERSWFSQWDQIETSWRYVEQIRKDYYGKRLPVYPYPQGQEGPDEADAFLRERGHDWVRK